MPEDCGSSYSQCRNIARAGIEILQFTPEGPLPCVRPYTYTDNNWHVYFDIRKAIVSTFGAAGYPVPETPVAHRTL